MDRRSSRPLIQRWRRPRVSVARLGQLLLRFRELNSGATFEKLAQRAHLLGVVRSFVTGDGNHDIKPIVGKSTMHANMGSLYSRVAGPMREQTAMPTNVALFPQAVLSTAGPAITKFWELLLQPANWGVDMLHSFRAAAGSLQEDMRLNLPQSRLFDRRRLLESLDHGQRVLETDASSRLRQSAGVRIRRIAAWSVRCI